MVGKTKTKIGIWELVLVPTIISAVGSDRWRSNLFSRSVAERVGVILLGIVVPKQTFYRTHNAQVGQISRAWECVQTTFAEATVLTVRHRGLIRLNLALFGAEIATFGVTGVVLLDEASVTAS